MYEFVIGQVWIIWGDGSCGYSVAEFDTFARFKLPVMALVGNDAAWTQILREQIHILGTDVACKLVVSTSNPDSLSIHQSYRRSSDYLFVFVSTLIIIKLPKATVDSESC